MLNSTRKRIEQERRPPKCPIGQPEYKGGLLTLANNEDQSSAHTCSYGELLDDCTAVRP